MKISTINPATEERLASYELLSQAKLGSVLEKSEKAFQKWREVGVNERGYFIGKIGRSLSKNKINLAKTITEEMGKPIKESIAEIEKCALLCSYLSKNIAGFLEKEKVKTEYKKSYVRFDPLGKILGIMPWNFPFWQVFRFSVPALCAGNSAILKHSGITTGCSLKIEKIFEENIGSGIFQSVITDSRGIESIISKVNGVSLTGSVETGRKIGALAGKNIK